MAPIFAAVAADDVVVVVAADDVAADVGDAVADYQ